jgi:phosphoglycolate phosphatase
MPRLVERIRAAAFDLDGTLVDSAPDLAAAANAMLRDLGHKALPQRRIESMIGHGIDHLVARALAGRLDSPPTSDQLATAGASFRRHYGQQVFARGRVYSGVVEGLRALAGRGIALFVVTNKASLFTRPLVAAAGLGDAFRLVLCADRPVDRKPSPNLLNRVRAHVDARPEELLYVGDSFVDVETARAAGCPIALVDYGYNGGRSLDEEDADWLIGSLAEIVALPDRGAVTC